MDKSLQMAVLGPMRLPFLILTPACILLGAATAVWSGSELNFGYLLLALAGGLAAHISVNALNEYDDFKSGLDLKTQPTPFSGGSGTLPQNPDKAHVALITSVTALAVTILIGVYFIKTKGWGLLPLGILGVVNVVGYTKFATRSPILCLMAPGLGFGPLMVMGTDFILTGSYSWTSLVASLVPFFLVSDLLLLNQFPDVEPDRSIGRRHIFIVWGQKTAVWVYVLFLAAAFVTVIIGYVLNLFPGLSLIALATVVIAVPTVRGAAKHADNIPLLIPAMGKNVVINILTPVLLATGLFFGR